MPALGKLFVGCVVLAASATSGHASAAEEPRPNVARGEEPRPNVIFILCDNLGYGDIGCFGNTVHRTPNLDRMAGEGIRLTHHYSASGVCSPSRAALMTGCYPIRVGLERGSTGLVLRPLDPMGISAAETTMAEMFRSAGYATQAIGKWHLGDQPEFLPTRHGFDRYLGIPYSEDMVGGKQPGWPPLPLMRNEQVIEAPVDRDTLTRRYTAEALEFITQSRDKPFFLYFPHAVPGSERVSFASPAFQGKSRNGRYGDAVEEMDWSVGEVLKKLKELDLDERTIVIWTNDNGAVLRNPEQGSNRPLGGWGYSTSEGAMRVPAIVRWPKRIQAGGECAELVTMMDWLPTLSRIAGADLSSDQQVDGRRIDGHDIGALLWGDGGRSPYDAFFYYQMSQLQAVRSDRWKYYLPLAAKPTGRSDMPSRPALFDVVADPGETRNLLAEHADVAVELSQHAERARRELGDLGAPGTGVRQAGRVEHPTPRVMTSGGSGSPKP
jgi:arylsulfatase A-like enzyme